MLPGTDRSVLGTLALLYSAQDWVPDSVLHLNFLAVAAEAVANAV